MNYLEIKESRFITSNNIQKHCRNSPMQKPVLTNHLQTIYPSGYKNVNKPKTIIAIRTSKKRW